MLIIPTTRLIVIIILIPPSVVFGRVNNIKGRILKETDKAVFIKFKSGGEHWIPKSTLKSKFIHTTDYQIFTIDTWVLKKNKIIVDENFLIRKIVNNVKTHHSDNLIAVYGIGSFFDENL